MAAIRLYNARKDCPSGIAEYQSAVEEVDPIFEQGMERYKQK